LVVDACRPLCAKGNGVDGSANVPRPAGSSFISLHRPPHCSWQVVVLDGCDLLPGFNDFLFAKMNRWFLLRPMDKKIEGQTR